MFELLTALLGKRVPEVVMLKKVITTSKRTSRKRKKQTKQKEKLENMSREF